MFGHDFFVKPIRMFVDLRVKLPYFKRELLLCRRLIGRAVGGYYIDLWVILFHVGGSYSFIKFFVTLYGQYHPLVNRKLLTRANFLVFFCFEVTIVVTFFSYFV